MESMKKLDCLTTGHYTLLANNTLSPIAGEKQGLLGHHIHMYMGITTEVGELVAGLENAYYDDICSVLLNFIEEIGDMAWFITQALEVNEDYYWVDTIWPILTPYDRDWKSLSKLTTAIGDVLKKEFAYKDIEFVPSRKYIKDWMSIYNIISNPEEFLYSMLYSLTGRVRSDNVTLLNRFKEKYHFPTIGEIMYLNIVKLQVRYGDKFSSQLAITRELTKEANVFEELLRK